MRAMDYVTHALQFFDDVVSGWKIGDLDNLETKIPHVSSTNGNCNFPIALYVFSCLEFLGYLTSPTLIESKNPGFTAARINAYMDMFFDPGYLSQIAPHRTKFVTIFRNGLAHEYFAKGAGVSRNTGILLRVDFTGIIILDADEMYKAFKKSVEKLKKDITDNKDNLAERIITRYSQMQVDNEKYKSSTTTYTSSVSTSMASLPHPDALKSATTLPYKKQNP